jgi:hypothetical protein
MAGIGESRREETRQYLPGIATSTSELFELAESAGLTKVTPYEGSGDYRGHIDNPRSWICFRDDTHQEEGKFDFDPERNDVFVEVTPNVPVVKGRASIRAGGILENTQTEEPFTTLLFQIRGFDFEAWSKPDGDIYYVTTVPSKCATYRLFKRQT